MNNELNEKALKEKLINELTGRDEGEAEDELFEEEQSLEDIIREVAEEEGLTYNQALALFKKGLKDAHGILSKKKVSAKQQKSKLKKKKKIAKASKKRNR